MADVAQETGHDVINIVRPIIEQTLHGCGLPSDVSHCISAFSCDDMIDIRYSVFDDSVLSAWPSLTMENDNAIVGFVSAESNDVTTSTFAVSVSIMQRNGDHSKWLSVGAITNTQRMFGLRAQSLGCPFRLRIQNEHGEEKLFMLSDTPRAVFGSKSDNLQSVNARTVKNEYGSGTVLCGDGKAINGALCDRFRILFRTNAMKNGFYVGFVHSEAAAMDLDEILGFGPDSEHSVGINVWENLFGNNFSLYDKENKYGKDLPSQLSPDVRFPVSAQEWLVEFDFEAHSLRLFLRLPKQWALAIKLEMQYSAIIPAFTLSDRNSEIEILRLH